MLQDVSVSLLLQTQRGAAFVEPHAFEFLMKQNLLKSDDGAGVDMVPLDLTLGSDFEVGEADLLSPGVRSLRGPKRADGGTAPDDAEGALAQLLLLLVGALEV